MLTFTSPPLAAAWLKERVPQGALHADSRSVGAGRSGRASCRERV